MLKTKQKKPILVSIISMIALMLLSSFILLPAANAASNDYVQDNAGVLSESTVSRINNMNTQFKANKLPELYVYTADSPDGGDTRIANDYLIKHNTDNPDYSIMLFLYTQTRSKGLRYGSDVPSSITSRLTDDNIYGDALYDLKNGDYNAGMLTAAHNTANYIMMGSSSSTGSSMNASSNTTVVKKSPSRAISKSVTIVLLGIVGLIASLFGLLMGFASIGRSKNSRMAVSLIKKHANDNRFGSAAFNSKYTDDGWAAALIRNLNETDELNNITSDKTALKACYDAGRNVYMSTGYKDDIQNCEYYDASIDYTSGIRDSEILMDSFNLQAVVDRVNKARKASMADNKRLHDAIDNSMSIMNARTTLTDSDKDAITNALSDKMDSLLLGGTNGERKPDTDAINSIIENAVVNSKVRAFASRFLNDNAYKKESLFDDDRFIKDVSKYGAGNASSVLAGNMAFLDDYAQNMMAKLNEDAVIEKKRRDDELARNRRNQQLASAAVSGAISGLVGYELGSSSHHHDYGGFDSGFDNNNNNGFGGFDSGFGNDGGGFDSGFGNDGGGFDSGF